MAGRRVIAPRSTAALQMPSVDDENTQRALDKLAVVVAESRARSRVALEGVNLVVGTNRITHGLGRRVVGAHVTPSVASAAFGYALDTTNPRPDLEVWIAVVGTDQPRCVVEVW